MIAYCQQCRREALPDEVSERGKHEVCGAQVRRIDTPVELPMTWWQRHWLDVLLTLVGVGLAAVIAYNAWGG